MCMFVIVVCFVFQVYLDGVFVFILVFVVFVKEVVFMFEGRDRDEVLQLFDYIFLIIRFEIILNW